MRDVKLEKMKIKQMRECVNLITFVKYLRKLKNVKYEVRISNDYGHVISCLMSLKSFSRKTKRIMREMGELGFGGEVSSYVSTFCLDNEVEYRFEGFWE